MSVWTFLEGRAGLKNFEKNDCVDVIAIRPGIAGGEMCELLTSQKLGKLAGGPEDVAMAVWQALEARHPYALYMAPVTAQELLSRGQAAWSQRSRPTATFQRVSTVKA